MYEFRMQDNQSIKKNSRYTIPECCDQIFDGIMSFEAILFWKHDRFGVSLVKSHM